MPSQTALSPGSLQTLTAREREILALLARGMSNSAICSELWISSSARLARDADLPQARAAARGHRGPPPRRRGAGLVARGRGRAPRGGLKDCADRPRSLHPRRPRRPAARCRALRYCRGRRWPRCFTMPATGCAVRLRAVRQPQWGLLERAIGALKGGEALVLRRGWRLCPPRCSTAYSPATCRAATTATRGFARRRGGLRRPASTCAGSTSSTPR